MVLSANTQHIDLFPLNFAGERATEPVSAVEAAANHSVFFDLSSANGAGDLFHREKLSDRTIFLNRDVQKLT